VALKLILATEFQDSAAIWLDRFAKAMPDHDVKVWNPDEPNVHADYAIVWRPPEAFFRHVSGLKAIFNLGAGVDGLMALSSLPRDVPLVRLEDAGMATQIAEYVAHGLSQVSREFDVYQSLQQSCTWKTRPAISYQDWPVGVMGLGVIGRRVAQTIAALGYPVAGWARSPRQLNNIDTYSGPQGFRDFLARTRVLVNVLPLTPETENLIDREVLAQLRPEAYLINVARGAHVVDEDLLAMLDEGSLKGALLDVFRQEPLPASHAYWSHPKVRITPHISGITLASETVAQISGKLDRLGRGQAITGLVSGTAGY
jgi:glyoxylate/hydroxypyruvate reductase A